MERGVVFFEGIDGWTVMLNPNPLVSHLRDEQVYMAISPKDKKKTYCGNAMSVMYLVTDESAAGWRKRNE